MATPPLASTSSLLPDQRRFSVSAIRTVPWPAFAAAALAAAGIFSLWSTVLFLWDLWRTDPLKSIGGFVPVVSLILILRAWRALGWETRGTWWGLALLAPTVALVHWRDHAVLELVLSPSWTIFLPPHSLVALAYVIGVVLLFGGTRLYRVALFPILLMLLVNPVPHAFNRWVDLPLQHASAATARAFAHALGQRLTPSELYLMFTPRFGMFIAPGCNGIRGSVTMGFLALVAGYLYRFRTRVWMGVIAAAVLLGYGFNLVRLCVLVLYYVVALRIPWLQSRAEMGDYLIGAVLFFGATVLLFAVIQRCSPHRDLRPPPLVLPADQPAEVTEINSFWPRWGAFLLLVCAGSVSYVRGLGERGWQPPDAAIFPERQGSYLLRRTWQEKLSGGQTIFDWGEYAQPGSGTAVAVGISPVLGAHDTLLCHTARGEDWLWHGALPIVTSGGQVSFSASLYNDGTTESMEATTVCSGESCGQWSSARRHFGLVYSRPETASLLGKAPSRPIPVLLKVESLAGEHDGTPAEDTARLQLELQLRQFLAAVSLPSLTRPYRLQ